MNQTQNPFQMNAFNQGNSMQNNDQLDTRPHSKAFSAHNPNAPGQYSGFPNNNPPTSTPNFGNLPAPNPLSLLSSNNLMATQSAQTLPPFSFGNPNEGSGLGNQTQGPQSNPSGLNFGNQPPQTLSFGLSNPSQSTSNQLGLGNAFSGAQNSGANRSQMPFNLPNLTQGKPGVFDFQGMNKPAQPNNPTPLLGNTSGLQGPKTDALSFTFPGINQTQSTLSFGQQSNQPSGLFQNQPSNSLSLGLGQPKPLQSSLGTQQLFGPNPQGSSWPSVPTSQAQPYFEPNNVFVFNNLLPKSNPAEATLPTHTLINKRKDKQSNLNYLFQVSKHLVFEAPHTNKIACKKLKELDKALVEAVGRIDETVRKNHQALLDMKAKALETERLNDGQVTEKLKESVIKAKELHLKVEQLFGQLFSFQEEFKKYQLIVQELSAKVPSYPHQYLQKVVFPSPGLSTLNSSLIEKLSVIKVSAAELTAFFAAPASQESEPDFNWTEYVEIIDELFYCIRVLSSENASLQAKLRGVLQSRFGQPGDNEPTGMVFESHNSVAGISSVNSQLNKIIQ